VIEGCRYIKQEENKLKKQKQQSNGKKSGTYSRGISTRRNKGYPETQKLWVREEIGKRLEEENPPKKKICRKIRRNRNMYVSMALQSSTSNVANTTNKMVQRGWSW
jgi:hypothetical protein